MQKCQRRDDYKGKELCVIWSQKTGKKRRGEKGREAKV